LFRIWLTITALLLFPVSAQSAAPKDWSRTVSITGEGAYVIGNPDAKNRLVEYVSYTCSHCADFVRDGTAPLKSGWVKQGLMSIEVRNFVRDRYDLTAALLARCGGKDKFFGNHEAILGAYDVWLDKVRAHAQMAAATPSGEDRPAQLIDMADKTGLFTLLQKRGVSLAQAKACIADPQAMEAVVAMTKKGVEQNKVTGTPSFLLNGKLLSAHSWDALRPMLPAPAN